MTKPTTPMATTISSQDISFTPVHVGWTTGSDATEQGGTSASAHGTSSGLTIDPPGLVPAPPPGTADQPALRRAGRGRTAKVEDVTTTQPTERTGAPHVSPDRSHDHQRGRADRGPRGRPRAAPEDRQVPDPAAADHDRRHHPALHRLARHPRERAAD